MANINPYKYEGQIAGAWSRYNKSIEDLRREEERRQERYKRSSQVLRIGKSLIDSLQDTNKLVDYAKEKGFKYEGSVFNKIFGGGKYLKDGKEFKGEDLLRLQYYDEMEKAKSLWDIMYDTPETDITWEKAFDYVMPNQWRIS